MTITIQELQNQSAAIAAHKGAAIAEVATNDMKSKIEEILSQCHQLGIFTRQHGRDECAVEESGHPYIQIAYDLPFGRKYATELVFTLREEKFCCYVRTWHFPKGYPTNIFELANKGDLDHDVFGDTFDELVEAAIRQAIDHRATLAEDIGITFTDETRESLKTKSLSDLTI